MTLKGNIGYSQALYPRPTPGSWHHYVAIYDKSKTNNEIELYLDIRIYNRALSANDIQLNMIDPLANL